MQRHSLIELAMERVARNASNAEHATEPGDGRLGGGEQIQTQTIPGQPPALAPAPMPMRASSLRRGGAYSGRTLVLTGLLSAVGTAGLTWLATGSADRREPALGQPTAALAPAVSMPPATPPPDAQVAAVTAALPAQPGEAQARALVERWRQAWASRDADAYLDCYGVDFQPIDGQSRSAWAAARRKKLSTPAEINVRLHDMRFERVAPDRLRAVFLQDYASGRYRETARPKTLLLSLQDGEWRIAGEWQGMPPASAVGRR
ncbi:MAG: hypothetical protein IPL03_13230 [Sterolibacteriaceae bacterium]|nr:hypothetical protein [Candidatus Methylophosphatis haderslevensis]